MPSEPRSQPSFSLARKWGIGLHVFLLGAVVLAVVAMLNYLSHDYYLRLHLAGRGKYALSSRTLSLLHSITNRVEVILYYDREESLYGTITELLNEYKLANSRITVRTVDYLRDAGAAQKIKTHYGLAAASDKNLVIFDCNGEFRIVPGASLAQYTLEQVPNEKEREYRRKPVSFAGEKAFTAALLFVTSPRPLKAYFLTGHGEHATDSTDELKGYQQFTVLLWHNRVAVAPLNLLGTNGVPADCNLLVIAGPTSALLEPELQKIQQYLDQGGRMLALFNSETEGRPLGLEKLLAQWGVEVGERALKDMEHTASGGLDLIVSAFTSKHPVVNRLFASGLYLVRPRPVSQIHSRSQAADAPQVTELAFTGEHATLFGDPPGPPQRFPVAVAVERGAIKGVATEHGTTRIVVVGDSLFLANHQLDLLANRDFADSAANWLLDRPQLFEGIGPHPVTEYRLLMTRSQMQSAQWLLLGGLPGSVLLVGSLVWLRRRR